jgi:hypothetical protein
MIPSFTRIFICLCFVCILPMGFSQQMKTQSTLPANGGATKSEVMLVSRKGMIPAHTMDTAWKPVITRIIPGHETPFNEELQNLKNQKTLEKFSNYNIKDTQTELQPKVVNPTIGSNFIGNAGTGCPLDNTVAISNGGNIVSLVNSNISYYNTAGTLLYTGDIWSWYGDASLSNSICDPKVLYDSGADRFIFYTQTCDGISANSKVIVAFSTTNDPMGTWWYYEFTGNPLNDNSWFDYPKIGVSNNEFYVTGNLFYQGGGYNQSVLYQMNKWDGYSGGSIQWQYWSGIDGNPFTLLPLSYGQQGNYGPGIYLVSTETWNSSTLHFYDLTDDLTSASETLNHYVVSTTPYSIGGQAGQAGGGNLDVGDTRAQSGFYLNGTAHFVFHSDIGSGWNGINYNRLDVAAHTNTSATFGLSGSYDYCYPSVASVSTSISDKSVMIAFERAGPSIYPEFRVVGCDDATVWSSSVGVQTGYSNLSNCYDSNHGAQRWGDYTGISRKYDAALPTVWVSGAYANGSNYWNTWIAEIGALIGIEDQAGLPGFNLYPNPVTTEFKTQFNLPSNEWIKINIVNMEGQVVKELYNGFAAQGENIFTFNKTNLPNGVYFLRIQNNTNQPLKNEKFIIGN